MLPSTRTPEGEPNQCPICGKTLRLEPSTPARDAPCPHCGSLVWFPAAADKNLECGFSVYEMSPLALTKEQAIRTILERLVQQGQIPEGQQEAIAQALLKREMLGSTGIGRGVAIPHTTYSGITRLIGAVARVTAGIEFDSVDGQPVHTLYLLLSPTNKPGDHIRALESVARHLRGNL